MNYIRITNESYFDKDYNKTFRYQEKYKFFNVGDSLSTLVPMYKKLLQEVIGEKINETFQDYALSKSEKKQIQVIFEEEIDKTIPLIEPLDRRRKKWWGFNWKGKTYDLNLSLISPNSRKIEDYYKIVQICEECLEQNKPMYLSIE